MAKFGKRSLAVLAELHPDLQTLMNTLIQYVDVRLICGFRGHADQNTAYINGASKVKWPNSKHNKQPSLAVDVMLCPDGRAIDYAILGGIVITLARVLLIEAKMTHNIRWGGDWNENLRASDEKFLDAGHFEIITKQKG